MHIRKIFIAHSWTDVGVNIQTKAVAKKLSETIEVTFISQARIGKPQIIINNHLKIIEWPNKRPNKLKDFFFIIKKIIEEKPDAIIVHFAATNICMIASWLMRVKNRICWMHTLSEQYYPNSSNKKKANLAIFYRKIAYWCATHVIVLNEYGKRDAIKQYKIQPEKVLKIYNGINANQTFHLNNVYLKSIRFVGRIDKSKGIDILIKAFEIVHQNNKDVILEVCGTGNEEVAVKFMIKEKQLGDRVSLLGYFNNYEDAIKFIADAYCLVVPSRTDNFPTVILEAMANGVPVIASDAGGIPDMIENGKEGFLIQNENINGFANAIKILTENISLRNKMGMNARQTFTKKFSMEKHVAHVIDFISGLER